MTEASMVTLVMITLFSPLLVIFWRFGRQSGMASGCVDFRFLRSNWLTT